MTDSVRHAGISAAMPAVLLEAVHPLSLTPSGCWPRLSRVALVRSRQGRDRKAPLTRGREAPNVSEHRGQHGFTALHEACWEGHEVVASVLVQSGADVTAVTDAGWTALSIAATRRRGAIVCLLLEHGGSNVDAANDVGQTALRRACVGVSACVVTQLLEAGADPTLRDADGRTAADLAAQQVRHYYVRIIQEWYRAYTLFRARSVRDAALITANSRAPVDAAPRYLVDRATSGLTMPTVHVSLNQQHIQPTDNVGEEGHAEVDPVVVGGVVTVYAIEELNGEVFVELMGLMGNIGAV